MVRLNKKGWNNQPIQFHHYLKLSYLGFQNSERFFVKLGGGESSGKYRDSPNSYFN